MRRNSIIIRKKNYQLNMEKLKKKKIHSYCFFSRKIKLNLRYLIEKYRDKKRENNTKIIVWKTNQEKCVGKVSV